VIGGILVAKASYVGGAILVMLALASRVAL
jgi:hypothetical protein